jgi:hypothetical protein
MEVENIDWKDIATALTTLRNDGSLGLTLSHSEGGAYTTGFRLSSATAWQDYTYLNEGAQEFLSVNNSTPGLSYQETDPLKVRAARERAYNSTYFTSSWEYSATLKPLYRNQIWGNSSFQYTLKGLLAKTVFEGAGDDPRWEMEYGAWNKEKIETHQTAANVAATVMDKAQTLTVTLDLPPKAASVEGNATARYWLLETTARGRIFEPWDEELRKFEPLTFTETLRWSPRGSLQQQVIYDPDLEELTNLTTTLSWAGLSASLSALRSKTYTFNQSQGGWIQDQGEETLNLRDLRISYTGSFQKDGLWNGRLNFGLNLNSSLSFDLQRYTYSRLSFTLGLKIGIGNLLSLDLSTTSENSVIFRYFKDLPFFDNSQISIPPGDQNNRYLDLLNSLRFDDDSLRRRSGFKLKTFNLTLTHFLGDWTAKLGLTLSPYLDQTGQTPVYKFNNEISFVVQWIPISEVKTDISYNKETFVIK